MSAWQRGFELDEYDYRDWYADSAKTFAKECGYKLKPRGNVSNMPPVGWLVELDTTVCELTHIGVIYSKEVGFAIVHPGWLEMQRDQLLGRGKNAGKLHPHHLPVLAGSVDVR